MRSQGRRRPKKGADLIEKGAALGTASTNTGVTRGTRAEQALFLGQLVQERLFSWAEFSCLQTGVREICICTKKSYSSTLQARTHPLHRRGAFARRNSAHSLRCCRSLVAFGLSSGEADAFLRTGRGSDTGSMSEEALEIHGKQHRLSWQLLLLFYLSFHCRRWSPHVVHSGTAGQITKWGLQARNVLSAFLHHTGTESDKPDWQVSSGAIGICCCAVTVHQCAVVKRLLPECGTLKC